MSVNPLIDTVRETWDGDPAEHLFQLCRLWTEHHSARTGTCPVSYRDPSGPSGYTTSQDTGEDYAYWALVIALLVDQGIVPVPYEESDVLKMLDVWRDGVVPEGYNPHRAMTHIMQATHILNRLDDIININERNV